MKKIIIRIIVLILLISSIIGILIYDAYNFAPNRTTVRYESITDNRVSPDLDGLRIAFISDVFYGEFMDKERFENKIKKINSIGVDVVVIVGDLLSSQITEELQNELVTLLKSIDAPYGKFAVFGDTDTTLNNETSIITNIYNLADIELINDRAIKIYKKNYTYINLVGVTSIDVIDSTFLNIDSNSYTVSVTHFPDNFSSLPFDKNDITISGNSHGNQITIPFFGGIEQVVGSTHYSSGKYTLDRMKLDITRGLGTTNQDVRLFYPSEILVYEFYNE